MPLAPGTAIGPYEILSALGAGGMGEVYRARDARLNRDVAIKVLPPVFTADPDRLARFRREAQVLAALNHPNIGHIYGLEDSGPTHALVLELVEGPTLADRIAQGPVPLDEAVPIARQIADALEAAHEQGIIHRDLKPANIKVRPDGTVKVLDFGLAKALDPSMSSGPEVMNSPTLTARATMAGVIMGTAAYMSPEQARGRTVDRRADIWAFGVILYEMLTGTRAFDGDDVSITLAAVLKDDVDWRPLPGNLPPSIGRLLRRCLEKDPRRRLSAIGDARLDLEDLAEAPPATTGSLQPTRARWLRAIPWAIAAVGLAGFLTSVALWAPWRASVANPAKRISADIGVEGLLAVNMGPAALISPDERTVVVVAQSAGRNMLFVRKLDQLEATMLAGTDEAQSPFFSPDSQWIGFFANGKLKKVPVTGGAPITLCDAAAGRGGSWGEDGTIVFQPNTPLGTLLHRVPDSGGTAMPIGTKSDKDLSRRWPQILPGGKAVLYSSNQATIGWDAGTIMVQPLPDGEPKPLVHGGFHGRYVNSGHLLYIHEGTLFSVPFDVDRLERRGNASPVVQRVLSAVNTGGAQFSVSDAGTLLYIPGIPFTNALPVTWLDRTGKSALLRAEPADWTQPAFSPDGGRLAMTIGYGPAADIWTYDIARDTLTQLTFREGSDSNAVWRRDGLWIAYASSDTQAPSNIYWKRADGMGSAQRLTESPNVQSPFSFHPNGRYLAYVERNSDTGSDVLILPLEGDDKNGWKTGPPIAFANSRAQENHPAFSPDGRWLAYWSTEGGSGDIYVRPFPSGESKWRISVSPGGVNPVWSRPRNEIFYAAPFGGQFTVMMADYQTDGSSFRPGKPRPWYPSPITAIRPGRIFDVHPDGNRIAVAKPPDTVQVQRPVFVFNFLDELRQKGK